MTNRRRTPGLESLEPRALLMGFSMNPVRIPITFALSGTAVGTETAVVRSGEAIHALGKVSPMGSTRVSGTLRVAGTVESGFLKLDGYGTHLTLSVYGTVGRPLQFSITGTTFVPHSSFDFRVVDGGGHVTVGPTPGPQGPMVRLSFGR